MERRQQLNKNNIQWEEQQTVFWQAHHDPLSESGARLWWCAQDARNKIWAQFNRKSNIGDGITPLRIQNCTDDLEVLLVKSLPRTGYKPNLHRAVVDSVLMIVQNLILWGRVSFGLRLAWDRSKNPPQLEGAQINYVPTCSLLRAGDKVFQVIPSEVGLEGKEGRIIELNPDRIIEFVPPFQWRRPLEKIRRGLPLLERSQQKFMSSFMEQQQGEDFKSALRQFNIQLGRLTAPIGWNIRGLLRDEMADFQSVMRELHWRKFCIELRDGILETLSAAFLRVGQLRGETPRLIWEHLPTVKQVEEGVKKMKGGGIGFNEVLKPFR